MNANDFFDLESFEHRSLFHEGEPIWNALIHLQDFFLHRNDYKIEIDLPSSVYLENKDRISIGKGTVIEPGVMIKGPCIIGKNCMISHAAYIRPFAILADHVHVGHSSEIKSSILMNHASAAHFVYVGDSIVGNRVNLSAGVKCANLRLDRKEIFVLIDGKKIGTRLKKFGAVIGEESQIGCNSVINPGSLIAKKSCFYPLSSIKGTPLHQNHQVLCE